MLDALLTGEVFREAGLLDTMVPVQKPLWDPDPQLPGVEAVDGSQPRPPPLHAVPKALCASRGGLA